MKLVSSLLTLVGTCRRSPCLHSKRSEEFHLYLGVKPVCPTGTGYNFSKDAPILHFSGGTGTGTSTYILISSLLLKKQKDELIIEATRNQRLCTKAGSWRLCLLKTFSNWFVPHALCVLSLWMAPQEPSICQPSVLQELFSMLPCSLQGAHWRGRREWEYRGYGKHTMVSDHAGVQMSHQEGIRGNLLPFQALAW